jgi:hypothetical protein
VELEASAARLKRKDWPYPVIELYLGGRYKGALAELKRLKI